MNHHFRSFACASLLFFPLLVATDARGHGLPIDLVVDPVANRIAVQGAFDLGILVDEGPFFATDRPGVQVSSTSNGVASNSAIGFVATQGLLYWDGAAPANTSATLTVVPPVGTGYDVTATSGLQTGVTWGVYDGTLHWHRHGDYLLSTDAAEGIYGLVVQFVSPNYGPSAPVIVPFALGSWTQSDAADAVADWTPLIVPVSNTDFNNDGQFDDQDLNLWSLGYGIESSAGHGAGDADGDGDVDGLDFLAWQRYAGAPGAAIVPVPEPLAWQLGLAALVLSSARRFCGRGAWARRRH